MEKLHRKLMADRGFLGGVYRMIYAFSQLDIPIYAANAAYFIILAVIPTIVLILALLRFTSLDSSVLILAIEAFVPEALMPLVTKLVTSLYATSSTVLVSVTAVAAVWAASRGVYGLVRGLNRIYDVKENRSYLYTRLMSVVYMVLFIVLLLLTLTIHVFGQTLISKLPYPQSPVAAFLMELIPVRFFVLFGLQTVLFTAIFMALPNRRNKLLASLPGAILASLGWLIFSDLFSIYVDRFSNYPSIYGSLSALALAMLWLYICIEIVFYGGALNKYLMDTGKTLRLRRKPREKTLTK